MGRRLKQLQAALAVTTATIPLSFSSSAFVEAPRPAEAREWRSWGGDPQNTRYSPLSQVTGRERATAACGVALAVR